MHWIVSKPPHRRCVSNGPYNPVSIVPRGVPNQAPKEIHKAITKAMTKAIPKETPKETPKEIRKATPTQNETVMTHAKHP